MTIDNYTDREREFQREIERLTAELELAKMKTYAASISPIAKERDELRAALAERDAKGKTMIDFKLQATGIPESIEQYQLALDAAFTAGKAIAAGAAPVPMELEGIAETLKEGNGLWMTCNGCHESNEGHPNGPFSVIMNCTLGGGCSECGGIGAVWDTTDYEEMAESMACDLQSATTKDPA